MTVVTKEDIRNAQASGGNTRGAKGQLASLQGNHRRNLTSQQLEVSKDSVLGNGSWDETSQELRMNTIDDPARSAPRYSSLKNPYRLQGQQIPPPTTVTADITENPSPQKDAGSKVTNFHHQHLSMDASMPYSNRARSKDAVKTKTKNFMIQQKNHTQQKFLSTVFGLE